MRKLLWWTLQSWNNDRICNDIFPRNYQNNFWNNYSTNQLIFHDCLIKLIVFFNIFLKWWLRGRNCNTHLSLFHQMVIHRRVHWNRLQNRLYATHFKKWENCTKKRQNQWRPIVAHKTGIFYEYMTDIIKIGWFSSNKLKNSVGLSWETLHTIANLNAIDQIFCLFSNVPEILRTRYIDRWLNPVPHYENKISCLWNSER